MSLENNHIMEPPSPASATPPAGKPAALKFLVCGIVLVAAVFALLWLAGFAHSFIDIVVRIIRFFAA